MLAKKRRLFQNGLAERAFSQEGCERDLDQSFQIRVFAATDQDGVLDCAL
jgi:hypothetical protein